MTPSSLKAGGALRASLRALGFRETVLHAATRVPMRGPWPQPALFRRHLRSACGERAAIFALLALGEEVPDDVARSALGAVALEQLETCGLLQREQPATLSMRGRALVCVRGAVLLADLPPWYRTCRRPRPETYIGEDSAFLAELLPRRPHLSMVDACTGSGVLAIVAARSGMRVEATEVLPVAAEVARFNAALNGVAHRITVHEGSLLEPVRPRPVDLVCANPPFLAMPEGLGGFVAGDGGEDGMRALRGILPRLGPFLNGGGRALLMGGCPRHSGGLACGEELKGMAHSMGWALDLFVIDDAPVERYARSVAEYCECREAGRAAVLAQSRRRGWTHFSIFVLRIRASDHTAFRIRPGRELRQGPRDGALSKKVFQQAERADPALRVSPRGEPFSQSQGGPDVRS